ncbi:MAG: LysM peptidoglycan-binding domain-containing protein, partial [Methylococcales bacterium]|nr:LysM peptidoglycan-binding domain-containing protein [Methylococcales bacterium]
KKDDMLAKILMDLSQTATNEISRDVAKKVLKGLKVVGKVHKPQVQHARFQVLKSPDIPSLLVETAFITNKSDERKLNSTRHQLKIAKAVFSGVKSYFYQNPPMGTVMADIRKHTVTSGDTLGSIANQYDVRIASIRRVNRLKGDRILVGKRLLIPTGS